MPAWLQELQRLTRLELQFNSITAVADSIGELRSLTYLDLDSNKLQMLPNSIGRLASMAHLDLTNCDLRDLPESLRGMERLETLYLQGNPALSIPHEVLGPGWRDRGVGTPQANPKDILNYYWRIKSAERPLNEAKLILVGRGGVGKTSLVNQLIHNQFNPGEEKTEGINITEWPIRLNGAEDVRLHIWDFGGQEIMHATHQFFLTQRSIYLLVLNGRGGGEDSDAEYWLKLIESFGGESPVIVVLNKIEEHQFDLNRRALELKYPVRAFVETDCRSGNGIDDLWNVIARETDRLEHLRDAFPGSWFTIKNKLAGMRRNYVTFDQFRELCRENGEADQLSQESLAGYLHTLGIVLNYKDDPRLQDTHVLNPHWVTNGIYKIINSELLARNKGEIRLSDLGGILDVEEYPPPTRRFILDLMKKFDLCFTFPDDDAHYLIPELLDKQEPTDTAEFGSQPCLNFQYAYPILPEGLLPRFIVRTHTLSEGLPRWRSGVILSFEGNRALVKADLQERMVNISVLGPTPGRRRLLAVIRSDFERIHNDIRNLHPREMIPLPGHPETALNYRELTIFEQQGVRSFPKVVQNQILMVDVNAMLNGVDLAGTRERRKLMSSSSGAVRIFYSYSHRDESLRNELENHLKLLQRQGVIEAWSDRNIEAGEDWKVRIDDALERAHLILLLVSSDFLASDYCYELEMRRALERHAAGEARVVPIILRDVSWASAPFAHLQALPRDGLPVMKWQDRDTAWRNVTEGLERVVGSLRK
jgi:internalin A